MNGVRLRTLTVLGVLVLGATACDSVADNVAERAVEEVAEQAAGEGVEIDIDEEGGNLTIESSEGTLDIGGDSLPEGFPDGVPLPDDYEVAGSMTEGSDDATSFFVTVSTPTAIEDLAPMVEDGLVDGGWSIDDTVEMTFDDGSSTTLSVTRDNWMGSVSMTGADDETQVMYAFEQT